MWLEMTWNDARLTWNPDDFGSVEDIRLPVNRVWTPDLYPYNKASGSIKKSKHQVILTSDGEVTDVVEMQFRAYCKNFNIDDPWGVQNCTVQFGSWVYDMYNLDLKAEELSPIEYDYITTCSSKLLNMTWTTEDPNPPYTCCPEPYKWLELNISLKRRWYKQSEYDDIYQLS